MAVTVITEDETEQIIEGLLDVVPELPVTDEKIEIFLTTLRSIIPDLELKIDHSEDVEEDNLEKDFYKDESDEDMIDSDNVADYLENNVAKNSIKVEKIHLTSQYAIILTKRPSVTAGVLHELTQIGEKPSGIYRETALNVINEEFQHSKDKSVMIPSMKEITDFYPITPLSLSDSQEKVIKYIDNNKFIAVQGPPGTGKSQTIVNLVAHLIANGKTVLVASRMDKAVDVVADRLNELGAPFLALRAGRLNYQKQLSYELQDLLSGKIDIDTDFEDSLLVDVKDMKAHLDNLKNLEDKSEKIIKLEETWHDLGKQAKEQEEVNGKPQFITSQLKQTEIDSIAVIIKTLENNIEKSGFFANIANFTKLNALKKILKIKDFE